MGWLSDENGNQQPTEIGSVEIGLSAGDPRGGLTRLWKI